VADDGQAIGFHAFMNMIALGAARPREAARQLSFLRWPISTQADIPATAPEGRVLVDCGRKADTLSLRHFYGSS